MNCIACEVRRAKLRAQALLFVGKSPHEIVNHLSLAYGETYYLQGGTIWRKSKQSPFTPYKIARVEE